MILEALPHGMLAEPADASAGRGIAERRGVGKVKHLAVATLWLQGAVCLCVFVVWCALLGVSVWVVVWCCVFSRAILCSSVLVCVIM